MAWQEGLSQQIIGALDNWRDARDSAAEQSFFAIYGSPVLQAALGIDPASAQPLRKPGKSPLHQELLQTRIAGLKSRVASGGLREAAIRALIYVGIGRAAVDERGFEIVRRIRREQEGARTLPLPQFKALLRDQFYMLLIDQDAALAAIPTMLPEDMAARRQAFQTITRILSAAGPLNDEDQRRLARIAELFGLKDDPIEGTNVTTLPARAS